MPAIPPPSAEELQDEFRPYVSRPGPRCSISEILEGLPAEDRVKLQAALDSSAIRGSSIFRWLKARGIHAEQKTIQRHRRGECRCV